MAKKGILSKLGLKKDKEPTVEKQKNTEAQEGVKESRETLAALPPKASMPKLKKHSSFGDILALNKATAIKRKQKFADK